MRIDMEAIDVKLAAAGRWKEILSGIAGIDGELLDGKHHPCPCCGGKDRFRAFGDVNQTGGVICNQCHNHKNGDGLATLQWACGFTFTEAVSQIAKHLNMEASPSHRGAMERYCEAKKIPEVSLRKYGAIDMGDGTFSVPMYGVDGAMVSTIKLGLGSPKLSKGLYESGKSVGLFWAEKPQRGAAIAIVEGVKDAAALDAIGWQAVGLPGSFLDPKFAPLFDGCRVVIVPDRDAAGEKGSQKTAAALVGHADAIAIATLPGEMKETGGDGVREALAKGGVDAVKGALKRAKLFTGSASIRVTTLTDASLEYIEKLRSGDDMLLSSGFMELDDAMGGGVALGEMIVIAARPSHGKSAIALQWVLDSADAGQSGLIISQEMSALAFGKRSVQNQTRMTVGEIRHSTNHAESIVRQQAAEQSPIYIVEGCGDVSQVCDQVEEHVDRHNVSVVAIDYLQLLRDSGGKTRYEQVTNVSTRLRGLATRNNIVLLALAQLSRAVEMRPGMTPMLSDLKESGQIEQDADVALLLSWPWRFNDKYEYPDEFRIVVAKNRNREIKQSHVALSWKPEHQRFDDRIQEHKEFASWNTA